MIDRNSIPFTAEETKALLEMLQQGLTARQIAVELRAAGYPVRTRNAIISKVHRDPVLKRVGFARRPGPSSGPSVPRVKKRRAVVVKQKDAPATAPAPIEADDIEDLDELEAEELPIEAGGIMTLLESAMADTCRYPMNNPPYLKMANGSTRLAPGEHFLFCGRARANEASPYCARHARLCWKPPEPGKPKGHRRSW